MKKNSMFKFSLMIITFIFSFTLFKPIVFADGFDFCTKSGVVKSFQILGWCLQIIKIVVPILLIAMGSVEFGKAAIASDDNAIKVAISNLVKRAIAAVVVFFIPTIITFVIGLVNGAKEEMDDYDCLSSCISDPKNCVIPAGGIFGE